MSRHGAVQENTELVCAEPLIEDVRPHIKTVARHTSTTGALDDSHRDALPIGITSEAPYEDKISPG